MRTITFPDGSIFTSTALGDTEIETQFQLLSAQLLGLLISPLNLHVTLTNGSPNATVDNATLLYGGVTLVGTGIPSGTTILSLSGTNIVLSANATVTGVEATVAQDLGAPGVVRVGWQQQGQPGPSINIDSVAITCVPIDTPYSRLRDAVLSGSGDTIIKTDVFTRTWKTSWMFYGPNSIDNARAIKSALTTVSFADSFLAQSNIYINPDIVEPIRNPELLQGQWWERADLEAEFNEQITETLTVGTVGSVEVQIYTKDGKLADFTI